MRDRKKINKFIVKYAQFLCKSDIPPLSIYDILYNIMQRITTFSIKVSTVYSEHTFYNPNRKLREKVIFEYFGDIPKYRVSYFFPLFDVKKEISFEFENLNMFIDFISYFDDENNTILSYLLLNGVASI